MLVVTLTALLVIVCAIAHISIGVYVLRINPRSAAHRAFFFVVMPTAVWAFALALTHSAVTPTLWYARLAFSSGSLVPIALLTHPSVSDSRYCHGLRGSSRTRQ